MTIPAVNYPQLPKTGLSTADFVPSGWKIEIEKHGDINGDGISDAVIVLRETSLKNIINNDSGSGQKVLNTNPRILAFLVANKTGNYSLVSQNNKFIPRITNPIREDSISDRSIVINNGVVKISFSDSTWVTPDVQTNIYTFRWGTDAIELIGYDSSERMYAGNIISKISINYATGKFTHECFAIDSDFRKEKEWGKLSLNKRITIDNIEDGLNFDPAITYKRCEDHYDPDLTDIDGDGLLDAITVENNYSNNNVSIEVKVNFSSGAKSAHLLTTIGFGDILQVSGKNGGIILDYTSSYSNTEVYKWNSTVKKLCRFSDEQYVSGMKFISIYNGCLGIESSSLVSGQLSSNDYYNKNIIVVSITEDKAPLFNSPNYDDKSKMFLIKNDQVLIKEYQYKNNSNWFLVEYKTKNRDKPIVKWISLKSIAPFGN